MVDRRLDVLTPPPVHGKLESLGNDADGSNLELATNLLGNEDSSDALSESDQHEDELFGLTEQSKTSEKVSVIVRQSFPVVVSFFLGIGGTFINLVFAGQYVHESGDKSAVFAGISLANMFANVSCLSVLIGMSGAVETLGSQHNGAGHYQEVGIILQRSIIILGIITIPIIILWLFAADIFSALGVEDTVCDVIRTFIQIRVLTIPMDVVNESYEKYLMSIGVMKPSMWANISFNIFILFFDTLFVFGLGLHYSSLAWSWVISLYLSAFVQIGMSLSYPAVRRTLQPYNPKVWTNWKEFIELGLPGTVMLCSEWWAYEILTIFASMLGTAQVAAQTIIMQTASLAFMVPLGFGVACASIVGNALGASQKSLAIHVGKLCVYTILALEIIISLVMMAGGPYFVDLFTNDNDVKRVANRSIPFLAVFTMVDGLQGVCSGVLRGAGKQFIGAVANIIAFYAIGLPMAWLLCFSLDFGVNGLMMGLACGTVFQVVVLLTLIFGFEGYVYASDISSHVTDVRHSTASGFVQLRTDELENSAHGIAMTPMAQLRERAKNWSGGQSLHSTDSSV